jgi:hypothetical protein
MPPRPSPCPPPSTAPPPMSLGDRRARRRVAASSAAALALGLLPATGAVAQDDPAAVLLQQGRFLDHVVVEDRIYHTAPGDDRDVTVTDEFCAPDPTPDGDAQQDVPDCKPAAVSAALLPDGQLLYFNGLENLEYFTVDNAPDSANVVAQGGRFAISDQTRTVDFGNGGTADYTGATFGFPENNRAETDTDGTSSLPLYGPLDGVLSDGNDERFAYNDQALFCADVNNLYTGDVLAVGGTNYYTEPQVGDTGYGVVELEGTQQARIYDRETNTWRAGADMHFGRWYPTAVTLADGDQLVASGVTKLIKPVYPYDYNDDPSGAPSIEGSAGPGLSDSGRNVVQTEVYDVQADEWLLNTDPASEKSLPLFPRLHLLPNGDVFYNAAGQVYNPQGQAYDQALWNMASVYDTETATWTDLGLPGVTGDTSDLTALHPLHPGFRGSTSSIMLPLEPDGDGAYTSASFLSAGGTTGVTPGSYVAIDSSYITTVDVTDPDAPVMSGRATAPLDAPRWYGHGVALPDGSVLMFNGADRDEVVNPGSGVAETTPEIFDPVTETWTPIAEQGDGRTYHNMAMLLPDGRVMVAGHAPINDGYALYGLYPDSPVADLSDDGRNPTIQIYEPPYLHTSTPRPEILAASPTADNGGRIGVQTPQAAEVVEVALVRNPSITHLIDADQRTVHLPFTTPGGAELRVDVPPAEVVPPGDYMLFVMVEDPATGKRVPSVSAPVHVNGPGQ